MHHNSAKSRNDPTSSDKKTALSTVQQYDCKSYRSNKKRDECKAKSIDTCQRDIRLVLHML